MNGIGVCVRFDYFSGLEYTPTPMKKILLLLAGIACNLTGIAQSWNFGSSVGGRSNVDAATSMARDAAGNYYVTGEFEASALFGSSVITATGFADQFVSKFNAAGVHQWTRTMGGQNNIMETGGVAVDGAGNVYVTGSYFFNVVLNGVTYNANGGNDAFLAKYNTNGDFQWAQTISSAGTEKTTTIAALGNDIYLSGVCNQPLTYGSVSFASTSGGEDAFLMKLDTAGNAAWGTIVGGPNDDRGVCLSLSNNIVYWAGYFRGAANFNGTSISSATAGNDDLFIVRMNPSGTQQWVKRYGGNFREVLNGISQDTAGNPIGTGFFYGTVNFGVASLTEAYGSQPPAGNGDAFILKMNAADGSAQWVRHIRSSGNFNEVGMAASTDIGGSTYITGNFGQSNTTFGSNTGQTGTSLTATNGKDAFIAKYGAQGDLRWVIKTGGAGNETGNAILWDANGYVNIAGNFTGNLALGTNINLNAVPTRASLYLARYDGLTVGLGETTNNTLQFSIMPNPATDFVRISSPTGKGIDKISVYAIDGSLIMSEGFPFATPEMQLNVSDLAAGTYFIHVWSGAETGVRKIQVQ